MFERLGFVERIEEQEQCAARLSVSDNEDSSEKSPHWGRPGRELEHAFRRRDLQEGALGSALLTGQCTSRTRV